MASNPFEAFVRLDVVHELNVSIGKTPIDKLKLFAPVFVFDFGQFEKFGAIL